MVTRRALISGASIAGLSAAYWLRRTGWEVTVLERAPEFRDGGQNVDVRGVAREVLEEMGLTAAVREQNTTETGTVIVDRTGAVIAELPSDGPDGATAELEVLRGDLARTILDHLPEGVEIGYGDPIADVTQDEGGVTATTRSGRVLHVDLLVVAEGVRSRTRDLLFGDLVEHHQLGIAMAFGTIPRTAGDDDRWRWYYTVGGRQAHLRPDNHGTTRAILAHAGTDDLATLDRADVLARLRAHYADAGWETPRILDGFADTDDLYIDQLTRIHVPTWHRGRVCLIGDAAWCVTPLGGGGASFALTGGYVLAATLSQGRIETGLVAYEDWMRPLVDGVARLPRAFTRIAFPRTRAGLGTRRLLDRAITVPPLRGLVSRMTAVAGTERPLPTLAGART
ncbi:FAD-dependent monooxygenase [Pseudonocardia nematodicida]|uniref:FAD-dependent monooxygenase n=1 Tax=Pseudonocardia nematodicida TaxID=1206997 RepID=A0ABV1KB01_9PSEU